MQICFYVPAKKNTCFLCSKSSLVYLVTNAKHINSTYSTEQQVKNRYTLQGQIKSLMMSRNVFFHCLFSEILSKTPQKGYSFCEFIISDILSVENTRYCSIDKLIILVFSIYKHMVLCSFSQCWP